MSSEILIYQTDDGHTKIQTRFENETVWLTQEQISNMQNLHIAFSDKPHWADVPPSVLSLGCVY